MSKPIKITLPDEVAEWIAAYSDKTPSASAAAIIIEAYTQATQKRAKVNRWGGDRKSPNWDQPQDIGEPETDKHSEAD